MRNLKQILFAILVLTFITACDKDENDPKETLEKETISAKWTVNNSSDYESFEFNESGNYIVVKNTTTKSTNDQIILFGTYEIIDNTTIVLSDFGTLTISEVNEKSIDFTIQLSSNPDSEIIITASKQDEIQTSTNTDLLCRTWEMVTENGEPVAGTDMELTVLFSKAGTYFVSFANPEDESDGGLAQWKWNDEEETQLLYSWEEVPNWEEEDYVEIPELTASTLKMVEDEDTWVLQPVSNTKSAVIKSSKKSSLGLKSGFFKK
ncbi:hypothetical protein [Carboxylicivirga sp. N1Y90]|uniref:hypothetical protein n=1 Tax=Carboxylicivirga fragile TaxID=3417571 RepID=UPI003D351F77|nr:hypothetical protein [Marinilabiliaceae bacterium N1Y90]